MPKRPEFKTEAEWLEHLRLWFAGMALQGLTANPEIQRPTPDKLHSHKEFADVCCEYADAMIAEREKGQP